MRTIPRRRKKSRKLRGSRLHGFGLQRQHRRSGRGGGFGNAGSHKHGWTWYTAHWPDYFGRGRRGFRRPGSPREPKTINVGEIESRLEKFIESGTAKREGEILLVDLTRAGYDKLLGAGRVGTAMRIRVREFSRKAAEKIAEAGGEIVEAVEEQAGG